jgi:hypothetical protein
MSNTPADNVEFLKNLDAALRRQYRGRKLPASTPEPMKLAILKAFVAPDHRPPGAPARKAA